MGRSSAHTRSDAQSFSFMQFVPSLPPSSSSPVLSEPVSSLVVVEVVSPLSAVVPVSSPVVVEVVVPVSSLAVVEVDPVSAESVAEVDSVPVSTLVLEPVLAEVVVAVVGSTPVVEPVLVFSPVSEPPVEAVVPRVVEAVPVRSDVVPEAVTKSVSVPVAIASSPSSWQATVAIEVTVTTIVEQTKPRDFFESCIMCFHLMIMEIGKVEVKKTVDRTRKQRILARFIGLPSAIPFDRSSVVLRGIRNGY